MGKKSSILLGAIAVALAITSPAGAAEDPYAADPNRLVPFADTVQQVYTSGVDVWEVWICDVENWDSPVDLTSTVSGLNAQINSFFTWQSDGAYTTSFTAGGTVTSSDTVTRDQMDALHQPYAPDCESEVADASSSSPNGVLIVVDIPFPEGYATAGAVCPDVPFTGCRTTYPDNARRVVVGAATVTAVAPAPEPYWNTIAHEIGHTLTWAHSYGGLTIDPDTGGVSQYDNPMDIMSGGTLNGSPIGTLAYNRYAAGWLTPGDVIVHNEGSAVFDLAAVGGSGLGMVVIPGRGEGHFYTISARRKAGYDVKLPTAGVEVYEIDQMRNFACVMPADWPETWPCFATLIRVKPIPPVNDPVGTSHVYGIDETADVGGFTFTVAAASSTGFTIQISERDRGTFVDDDNNLHEPNIEAIAAAGITEGCNPPTNDRFCPDRPVSRAEMAAFLIRAMGLDDSLVPYQGTFPDVTEGEWYTPYVETLASVGVTTGYSDGTYRPLGTVSRAEMAVFVIRAFGGGPLPPASGVFADVPASDWYAAAAEQIYADGITTGCKVSPLRYCPNDQVLRDQMASFIARALGIGA